MEIYLRFGDSISFNILLWIHKQCCYYLKDCERIPGIVIFWSLCKYSYYNAKTNYAIYHLTSNCTKSFKSSLLFVVKILNNSIVKCRILTTDRPRENLSFYLLKAALFMAFSIVSSISGLLISSLYGATELRAFSITMVILGALEFGIGIAASVCCCLMKPCTCCCCVSQDEVLFVK